MPLGMEVGLSPDDFVVRLGPRPPSSKRGRSPQFSANVYCGQTTAWIKMPLGADVSFSLDDIVLDGDLGPLPKKGTEPPPQFSAHVYCGQTAGWIKMALGTEVGLGPGHIVLDEDPAPLPQKGSRAPIFRPFLQRAQCSHCKRCISYNNSVRPSVRLSVRLSVRHTPVLCQNDGT